MKPHIMKLLLHEGLKPKYIGFYRLGLLLELCPMDGSRIPLMGLYRQVGARLGVSGDAVAQSIACCIRRRPGELVNNGRMIYYLRGMLWAGWR